MVINMSIENLQEIQEYFTTNGENEEVKNYIGGFNKIDMNGVKSFLETNEEGKGYLNSYSDSKVTKGIETFKTNNLQKLIEAEMLKKNPSLTPQELKIQELEKKFTDMEKSKTKTEQMSKYKDVLQQKKIPSNMVDFLIDDDETVTEANITLFEDSMKSYIEEAIKTKFGSNVHIPSDATATTTSTISQEEWNAKKNDLDWYAKNKKQIYESMKQGLIKNK
ncbi:DUF4355 domain-containing protein [Clostridium tagluense]|uniref:DUF4355 domain-containing protein n=1 Tax=Clostridium tagluense TaxID=360422 RepID=A0A401ULQ4_9CLOT|nr:DUF4355 domain-containing protein [Clostridium tagluense]GCD10460.1 hypothetical protein Ctaglu_20830 [Clostridium tagluense]